MALRGYAEGFVSGMYRTFAETAAKDDDGSEENAAPVVAPEVETNRRVTPLLRIDHMVSSACETSNVSHRMLYLHDARRHLDHHMAVTKRNADNTPMIRSIEEKLSRAMAETIAMEQSNAEHLEN